MDHYAAHSFGRRTVQVRMPEMLGQTAFLADVDAMVALADQQHLPEADLVAQVQSIASRYGFSAYVVGSDQAAIAFEMAPVA